jgi:hypothetical protein
LLEVSKTFLRVLDAGGKLGGEFAQGVFELHGLLDVLAGRIDTSPEGGVLNCVERFLDFVEEGLVMAE